MEVIVLAEAPDAALAGFDGTVDDVRVRTGVERPGAGDVAIVLGDAVPAAPRARHRIHWPAGPHRPQAAAADPAARVVATDGEGLLRRMPWPARDDLFALADPAQAAVLVVADEGDDRRGTLVDALAQRGRRPAVADRLTREDLAAAGLVVLVGDGALPARAMAVPAAGRLLLTVGVRTAFGLQPGFDHLAAADADAAVAALEAAVGRWGAFAAMRRLGRLAAERHRASRVYTALARDLALLGDAA